MTTCTATRFRSDIAAQHAIERGTYCADPGWRIVIQPCVECRGFHVVQEFTDPIPPAVRERMCSSKARYFSERVAEEVCNRRSTLEQPLRWYVCRCCGLWHVTSQPIRG